MFKSPFTGQPVISFLLPAPGTDYVLRITVRPQWFSEQLRLAAPPGWIVAVADRSGTLVARSHEPERWVGQPAAAAAWALSREKDMGWARASTVEGMDVRTAWSRLPLGWTAFAAVDQKILWRNAMTRLRVWTV